MQKRHSLHRNAFLILLDEDVIYSIDATLAGKGFKDPTIPTEDFVELFVRTKVIDWGNATQSVVVE